MSAPETRCGLILSNQQARNRELLLSGKKLSSITSDAIKID